MTKKQKKFFITLVCIIFSMMAIIFAFAPYTCDDWFWGGNYGKEMLKLSFQNYNGRYISNLLILLISRSVVVKVIFMTATMLFLFLITNKVIKRNIKIKNSSMLALSISIFGLLLIFLTPRDMFVQTIVWASGFVNYVVSFCILLLYYSVVENVFSSQKPVYKTSTAVLSLFLGVSGGLFIENMTIFNIVFAFFIILYTYEKFKTKYAVHILFFIGSVIGAAIMFSNPIYGFILSGSNDGYRKISLNNSSSIVELITNNFKLFLSQMYEPSIIINLVILCLLFVVLHLAIKNEIICNRKKYICILLCFVKACVFIINTYSTFNKMGNVQNIQMLRTILFFISAVATPIIIIFCIKDKTTKTKLIVLLFSNYIMTSPLLMVSPVNARCFLLSYCLLTMFCLQMIVYIVNVSKCSKIRRNAFCTVCVAAIFACLFSYIIIYSGVYSEYNNRNKSVINQISSGATAVYIPKYSDKAKDWVYYANLFDGDFINYYKSFYGIKYSGYMGEEQ